MRGLPSGHRLPSTGSPLPAPACPGPDLGPRVRNAGTFGFQTRPLFLSATLQQKAIAFEETAGSIWSRNSYDVLLPRLDARDCRLYA
jgi:hypothetical protein